MSRDVHPRRAEEKTRLTYFLVDAAELKVRHTRSDKAPRPVLWPALWKHHAKKQLLQMGLPLQGRQRGISKEKGFDFLGGLVGGLVSCGSVGQNLVLGVIQGPVFLIVLMHGLFIHILFIILVMVMAPRHLRHGSLQLWHEHCGSSVP